MDQPKLSATFKVNSKDILGLMALTNHKFARMSGESTRSTHTNYMKPPIFSLFQPTLRCTAGLPFIGAGHHTIPYYHTTSVYHARRRLSSYPCIWRVVKVEPINEERVRWADRRQIWSHHKPTYNLRERGQMFIRWTFFCVSTTKKSHICSFSIDRQGRWVVCVNLPG